MVSIGSTAFDGAKEGALFNDLAQDLQRFFGDLGLSLGLALEFGFVVGLAGAVLIVGAIWTAGMAGMKPTASAPEPRALARAFAHTLIPIAAGYLVAHYFSLLAYNGQDLWRLANDPLGDGSDLFGGADAAIDYGVVSATGIWYVQVGALVVGHVAALVLAHDRALELYGSAARGDPLAGCHAGPDGGLHLPRALAPLGGAERMTLPSRTPATGWRSCSTWCRSWRWSARSSGPSSAGAAIRRGTRSATGPNDNQRGSAA